MSPYLCYIARKRRILQSVELSVKAMSWERNIFRERFCWYIYRQQTKVVFSQVFVCQQGGVGFTACITGNMREGLPPRGSAIMGVRPPPEVHAILWNTINKRAVRIILECFLVCDLNINVVATFPCLVT